MKLNKAFASRVREILKSKNMTLIVRELGVSLQEFFDSKLFEFENLEIE